MTSYARLKPFYVSLSIRNNGLETYTVAGSADETINATVATQFNSPIVEKASDFVIAIERMELSTNGIPFYDSTDSKVDHTIVVRSRNNPLLSSSTPVEENASSLSELFAVLNAMEFEDPNTNLAFQITVSVDADGFIELYLPVGKTFDTLQFEFPRVLNNILGISTVQQLAGYDFAASSYPRFDLGDDLDHIILRTDLPTYSDALGNAKMAVLTDFAPPSVYSNSLAKEVDFTFTLSGLSLNTRQKIIYTPSERRYLELTGDFPINNITIDAFYVNIDGKLKNVQLPLGGIFEIKLGFYLRQ